VRSVAVVAGGIPAGAPSSPAAPARKASSASRSPSTRSIDFASDRSPLQKLERELKHISESESGPNPERVVRSLSRRHHHHQDRRHREPTSPIPTSPTSHSSSPRHRPQRDSSLPTTKHREQPADDHHHHLHHHRRRPHNSLNMDGRSRQDGGDQRQRQDEEIARKDYYKTRSGAEDFDEPQPTYDIPPQNPTAVESNSKVGFMHHRQHHGFFGKKGHRDAGSGHVSMPTESIGAGFTHDVARLTLEDREFGGAVDGGDVLYQSGTNRGTGDRASHTPSHPEFSGVFHFDTPASLDGPADSDTPRRHHDPQHPSRHHHPDHLQAPHTKEEREDALVMTYIRAIIPRLTPDPKQFTPRLSVKCGPLLRYTGLRRDDVPANSSSGGRETWRGSVMIVTNDRASVYSPPPCLDLFYVDPDAGQDGKEDDGYSRTDELLGKAKQVESLKLHSQLGVTFWRFNLEVELADSESKIAYQINSGPVTYFWVPAKGQTMNIMFHSCNGFSLSVNPDDFCGPDPMWQDVLNKHKERPFHVMIGGGDQSKLLQFENFTGNHSHKHQSITMLSRSRPHTFATGSPSKRRSISQPMNSPMKCRWSWKSSISSATVCIPSRNDLHMLTFLRHVVRARFVWGSQFPNSHGQHLGW
jgi:hypothetical protein